MSVASEAADAAPGALPACQAQRPPELVASRKPTPAGAGAVSTHERSCAQRSDARGKQLVGQRVDRHAFASCGRPPFLWSFSKFESLQQRPMLMHYVHLYNISRDS